ncbi:MAG: DNA-binding transcriptional regulator [Formivibrio sp.]|nr:DNA-binding transcriptional regulator [Formivibrio sp.]
MSHNTASHRIALLFNANKIYDREIIAGIGAYLSSTRVVWDLFLEEDFRCRPDEIRNWEGDGIIADFDDPDIAEALRFNRLPIVAAGSSYENDEDYPKDIPYIATYNAGLIKQAYDHLIEVGLSRFAMYSMPESPRNRWAQEREKAFRRLSEENGSPCDIYRGHPTRARDWNESLQSLVNWLQGLPKPLGIIAVTDARARQVMQACVLAGIAVPEEIALVGIDNDPLTRMLTRIPLSSVIQGTEEIGWTAAQTLHECLHNVQHRNTRILVPPIGINVQASSLHQSFSSPYVMRAMHYIRQFAALGIKTQQVAEYVGISRSSLESYFQRERNCTVHDEILRFRLEMAKNLLANEQLTSREIAIKCGFTSLQYMHTVFKRELGCTPREYLDRCKTSAP